MATIGAVRWAIAEGYIPSGGLSQDPTLASHETVCILNASDREAHLRITVFFANRAPASPYLVIVPAQRARHI